MKGFETVIISTRSDIIPKMIIQTVSTKYNSMRVYYTGNMIFYRLNDLMSFINKTITDIITLRNPDIRYFINDDELISHSTLISLLESLKTTLMKSENPDSILINNVDLNIFGYSIIYDTYCKTNYEI